MDKKLMVEQSDLISLKTRSQASVAEVDLEEVVVADADLEEIAEVAEALVAEEASEVEEASEIEVAVVDLADVEAEVVSTQTLSTKIKAILSLLLERKPHSEGMGSFLIVD
jgi:hypothetical protein